MSYNAFKVSGNYTNSSLQDQNWDAEFWIRMQTQHQYSNIFVFIVVLITVNMTPILGARKSSILLNSTMMILRGVQGIY